MWGKARVVQRARLGPLHVTGVQPQPPWMPALCWVRGEEGLAEYRGAVSLPSRSFQPLLDGDWSC